MRWDKIDLERAVDAREAAPADLAALSRDEVAVIEMARAEGPQSARPDTRLRRLVRLLFGIAAVRPLANARLEAIRRFAVAAWFSDEIPERLIGELFEAGLSSNDTWRMLSYVGMRRGKMPEVEAWPG